MAPVFVSSWQSAWSALKLSGSGEALRDALLRAYCEPHRHYHTQQHLAECLGLFDVHREQAERPGEVALALWFHDAVYDLRGNDNEARSAHYARRELALAGADSATLDRIEAPILATRHQASPVGKDACLLVDIDLAILGADAQRFAEYEQQIRREYSFVPGFLFRHKRRSILRGFLDRTQIYQTPALHQQLEQQARANLALALR
jgi:predicted metal-dependent HD superfamily phosphohydrolase